MKEKISKVVNVVKKIPDKKNHLDFLAAALTIPVLISVIILNYNNLQKLKTPASPSAVPSVAPTQAAKPQYIIVPSQNQSAESPTPVTSACIKDIGPIDVSYPKEGDTVSDNPLCIIINYSNTNYCSVVWSYRINNGAWSDYTSNNPCIYNLQNGNIKFDLRVQSTVTQNTASLTRNFIYQGQPVITPTAPPPSTQSAALN